MLRQETTIKVRVKTGASKESLRLVKGVLQISVREKAVRNAANARVIALVAAYHRVPVKYVRITGGHHTASKRLHIS